VLATIAGLSGTDEVWYDPTTNEFYVTGNNATGKFFDIVSDNGAIIQMSTCRRLQVRIRSR
jgi:hypothetical protein